MIVSMGDSASYLVSYDNGEHGEDEIDEVIESGKLGEDGEPGWLLSRITKMALQCMEMFWLNHMKLYELTQLGWRNADDILSERDNKYSTSNVRVPAVTKLQLNDDLLEHAHTTFGE
jgi:hypothetical protein